MVWGFFALGLGATLKVILAVALICPVAHLFVGLPVGIAAHALTEVGFPLGGVLGFLIAALMLPGDPLLYLSCRLFPRHFPREGVRLFQVTPVLLLTRRAKASGDADTYEVSSISGV
jgi:hypothetical protein